GPTPARQARRGIALALGCAHHERRRRGLDDGAALELGEPRRDRVRRGAEPPGREAGLVELPSVPEREPPEVALAAAERRVGTRQPVRPAIELAAGAGLPLALHRDPL